MIEPTELLFQLVREGRDDLVIRGWEHILENSNFYSASIVVTAFSCGFRKLREKQRKT
jgi:hypothetical protein